RSRKKPFCPAIPVSGSSLSHPSPRFLDAATIRFRVLVLERGDDFDFDQSILGKTRDLDGRTGRRRHGEILSVDLVHGREVIHVLKKNRGLDHMMQIDAARFENPLYVFQHPLGLLPDITREEFVAVRIESDLAGSKKKSAGFDGLRIRSDRLR